MILLKTLLLLLSIFLIPLMGANGGFGYEHIKILFFILSISLIGFIWLLKKPEFKWDLIKITSLVFVTTLFVTSALGIDPKISFLGNDPYYQGWVLYAYLFLFALMVSQAKITLRHWAICLSCSAVLVSVLGLKDWVLLNLFAVQIPNYAGRVVSTFGQPNFYAGFLLLTLPFSYYLFKSSTGISQSHSLSTQGVTLNKLSYFGIISGLISITGIFVSYSRSTILMVLILLILGLIDQLKIKLRLALIVFGIVLISFIIAFRSSSGLIGNEVVRPLQTANPDLTKEAAEKRLYVWPLALKIALQKPLSGFGLENIGQAFFNYFEENKHSLFEENLKVSPVLISLKELYISRSHNYILDLLLFSGILGLIAWIMLVVFLIKKAGQAYNGRTKNVLFISLITYLIWVQFQNQSIVHLIYFWLLAGLIDQKQNT